MEDVVFGGGFRPFSLALGNEILFPGHKRAALLLMTYKTVLVFPETLANKLDLVIHHSSDNNSVGRTPAGGRITGSVSGCA
jgi:hypothetical protein